MYLRSLEIPAAPDPDLDAELLEAMKWYFTSRVCTNFFAEWETESKKWEVRLEKDNRLVAAASTWQGVVKAAHHDLAQPKEPSDEEVLAKAKQEILARVVAGCQTIAITEMMDRYAKLIASKPATTPNNERNSQ